MVRQRRNGETEEIINNTIIYLASNNCIKYTRDAYGEIDEIMALDDDENKIK